MSTIIAFSYHHFVNFRWTKENGYGRFAKCVSVKHVSTLYSDVTNLTTLTKNNNLQLFEWRSGSGVRGRPHDPALRSLPVRFSNRRHILPRISHIASNDDLSLFEMIL